MNVLKQLTRVYVIDDPSLETQQYGQRRAVRELFGIYHGAASTGYDLRVFPVSYREQIEATDGAEDRVRIVGDLMSSMTEQQLLRTYQRLTGIDPGSVMDLM